MKKPSAVKVKACGATFGSLTWMPCVLPNGHDGLHHGECNEPGRVGRMDWMAKLITALPSRRKKK